MQYVAQEDCICRCEPLLEEKGLNASANVGGICSVGRGRTFDDNTARKCFQGY